jgi:hypothetical protein
MSDQTTNQPENDDAERLATVKFLGLNQVPNTWPVSKVKYGENGYCAFCLSDHGLHIRTQIFDQEIDVYNEITGLNDKRTVQQDYKAFIKFGWITGVEMTKLTVKKEAYIENTNLAPDEKVPDFLYNITIFTVNKIYTIYSLKYKPAQMYYNLLTSYIKQY